MTRGQIHDAATKMRAIAEVDMPGASVDDVAAKYDVSPKTLGRWKELFDAGESLDPPFERKAREREARRAAAGEPGKEFRLDDGTMLPALPPLPPDRVRRAYDSDFKYLLGRALLSRRAVQGDLAAHYEIDGNVLRAWARAVEARELKPSTQLRAQERAQNGASAQKAVASPTANGHRKAPTPPTAQLSIEGIPMPTETTQLIAYAPPAPRTAPAEFAADLLTRLAVAEQESARLRAENEKLRADLRAAFDMVLSR